MKMPALKVPKIKVPDVGGKIKTSGPARSGAGRVSNSVERIHTSRILLYSIIAILMYVLIVGLFLFVVGKEPDPLKVIEGTMGNVLALLFAVIIIDSIHAREDKRKNRRSERKAIVRHNKIIQPIVDMYIVRKNMVITPNDKTVKKFQINSTFTIKDMKDMYGQSELVSDVGKSKIEIYAFYQDKLTENFINLVEDIDFDNYNDLCEAAMEYINATSYGASALEAVLGYQNAMAGTKAMKSVVLNMMRDEPANGNFINAHPTLKNVYLVHGMINDQEKALGKYLKLVSKVIEEDDKASGKKVVPDVD